MTNIMRNLEKLAGTILLAGALTGAINELSVKNEEIRDATKAVCMYSLAPLIAMEEYRRFRAYN